MNNNKIIVWGSNSWYCNNLRSKTIITESSVFTFAGSQGADTPDSAGMASPTSLPPIYSPVIQHESLDKDSVLLKTSGNDANPNTSAFERPKADFVRQHTPLRKFLSDGMHSCLMYSEKSVPTRCFPWMGAPSRHHNLQFSLQLDS